MALFGTSLSFNGNSCNCQPVITQYGCAGSFCWAKCPNAVAVGIITIGGGGGGGDSTNTCTAGCGTYYYPGGGAGGGGGISSAIYNATQVATCAAIVVGNGGSRGIPGSDGGPSCFVGGVCVSSTGGRYGEGSTTPNSNVTNGGVGGAGTAYNGAAGGAGRGTVNGDNGETKDNSARGGGGGGGARYCSVVPTSITYTSKGVASPITTYDNGWACIDLEYYGCGGMGGDASMNNQRSVSGTAGNTGLVYVVQYF